MDQVYERENSFDGSESSASKLYQSSVNERASPQKSSLRFTSSFGNRMDNAGMATTLPSGMGGTKQAAAKVPRDYEMSVSFVDRPNRDEEYGHSANANIPHPFGRSGASKKEVRFSME